MSSPVVREIGVGLIRVGSVLALAVAGVVLLSAPALAAEPPDQVVLSGNLVVARGTEVGEVVVLHGTVRVDGVVNGDVVVANGPVVVRGQVSGSVVAVDGRVALGPSAQVTGDVSARGPVVVAQGARVGGRIRQHVAYAWRTPIDVVGPFASWLAVSVSTLLFGLVVVLLAPRAADAVARVARSSPWPAAGWAVAIAIGVPVAVLLALASLVALPLGMVALLGIAPLAFAGYALAAYATGRALSPPPRNRAVALILGWLILRAIATVPLVSGVTFALAATYGIGAAAVATWRARATGGRHRGRRRAEVAVAAPFGEEAGL